MLECLLKFMDFCTLFYLQPLLSAYLQLLKFLLSLPACSLKSCIVVWFEFTLPQTTRLIPVAVEHDEYSGDNDDDDDVDDDEMVRRLL